jgi:hypothetical protein
MAALEVALRTVLAVVFGAAFVSKVRSPAAFAEFADSLGDIGWLRRRPWQRSAIASAITVLEAVTVTLFVMPWTVSWGFGAGVVLLAAFTIVTGREVAQGRRVRCRCFGAGTAQIGPAEIARNVVLLSLSAAGLAIGPLSHGGVGAAGLVYAFGLAGLAALTLVRWDDLVSLMRTP